MVRDYSFIVFVEKASVLQNWWHGPIMKYDPYPKGDREPAYTMIGCMLPWERPKKARNDNQRPK
jgi:hypothetical protein